LQICLPQTFSSTTKRSLQPHDDKLLIGGQQFLISVSIFCACHSLKPMTFNFRTAVFSDIFCHLLFYSCRNITIHRCSPANDNNMRCRPWQASTLVCLR